MGNEEIGFEEEVDVVEFGQSDNEGSKGFTEVFCSLERRGIGGGG